MPDISITDEQAAALARGENVTLSPEPQEYPGGFRDGDVVVGPFVRPLTPRQNRGTWKAPQKWPIVNDGLPYGIGFGVVEPQSSVRTDRYVPVRIIQGDRLSGGYSPENLTKIEGATPNGC